jgi:hypothetical protein
MVTEIKCINLDEVIKGVTRSLDDIKKAQNICAKQMGITARKVIRGQTPHPMHVLSTHWQKSINYHVAQISDLKVEVTVGSNGAERYYYLQEAINHPIAIGWHKVQPQLTDIYQKVITQGLLGKQVTQNISSDDVDEFAMMGGM